MIIHTIFICVGALLLGFAIADLKNRIRFVKTAERASGTLVELVEKSDDEGTVYYPVFEIPTLQNETLTFRHTTGFSNPPWQLHQSVPFIFEPGKPETLRMFSYWSIYWWPLCLLAISIDLLLIGGGYFLFHQLFGA
ncbi:hypothetical protein SAMN05444266_10377 [Chitinophaga jiangningensis]|uniref:DUF3592 domain-containing protein n=1 Tax=Chitinophaga jiangningensis TaxID=1419482 RepID=A0A1M7A133_9BACT|nr:DUF3592 domain-containing protein [Chitinophaga jiangningensis]SHL36253.1 hypothetical protein SAMN05444266_10377 [Chitinophaga jiangningensis]